MTPAADVHPVRRAALVLVAALVLLATDAHAFGFDDVARRAEKLAAGSYRKPNSALPPSIKALDYDQYRAIRFRPEHALWRNAKLPFEIMFFHRGWFYEDAVVIREVSPEGEREIPFDADAFDYGANKINRDEVRTLGFAGFRVHYPINQPGYKDEVLVFLGASYFRALGRGQRFGLSARALAIDTAESTGEEFPRFVEFWIERPPPNARQLTVYGLLDSPRAAGAYRFVLTPGVTTVVDVDARLFLRRNVAKLGLAPLTSMFYFGANQRPPREDYRPRVHDSHGLSIQVNAKEWIWRPLVNPRRLLVTSFAMTNPRGFGLMQRERDFDAYEDLEARYDLRPSAWVELKGPWGPGRVELVQIPVRDETNDNIVAYWVPDWQPRPKEALPYSYRVHWQKERETRPTLAWVQQTRRGRGYVKSPDASVELHVDFAGGPLSRMPADAPVDVTLWMDGNGEVLERRASRNEATGGLRFVVRLRRIDANKPVELRAHLHRGEEVLSETWSYILPPD
ncbi:MAG TPA: glucan biosynthesis protein G [Candidatus Tectomicrobia bacterium]|nr:glucan biosynthesis protein G [Candidatus Tectomicrobia bacterium]